MAGDWSSAPLEELVEDILDRRGVTPLKLGSDFVSTGYRVISAKLIKDGRIDLSADDPRFVDRSTYEKWMRTSLLTDDVILTSEAPLGELAYIAEPVQWCLGQRLFCIRTKKSRLHGRFLYYALQSEDVRRDLLSRATGTTAQGIRQTELRRVLIPLPHPDEQRAIAHILGTLDDKIELNHRTNETLEAMARAIFRSWFVDFDPVRAKAEGRDPGLPKPIADLFPNRLEDSEVGEIPAGWQAGSLADFVVLNPESWSTKTRPAVIEYIDLSNTKWGRIEAVIPYSQLDAPSRAQRVLKAGDTIVGTVRPGNGSYAYVTDDGLTGSSAFAVLRPRASQYREFVYLAATAAENIAALSHLADGGAYPAVSPEVVISTRVASPSHDVVRHFATAAGPLLAKIAQNERDSRTLVGLRNELLPKLISGELRVKDAKRFIGATVQ